MDESAGLPFGVGDIEQKVQQDRSTKKLKCIVKGCTHWLNPPLRGGHRGDVCPIHGIRMHRGKTYSYADYRRNLIVDADYFERHIRSNEFKYECHRFGQERSEDAVTWNVFRSLQRAGMLHRVVQLCTGISEPEEPRLFLWGLELQNNGVRPWDLLIKCRERFESDLPEGRPKTEPDIGLHLPGRYLLLIEAKFTSPNGVYERDRVTRLFDLTIDQLVRIYQDKSHRILNYPEAAKRNRIHYQLWRNMTFAEAMSIRDSPNTRAFHASLIRAACTDETCEEFLTLIHPAFHERFEQITWEQIHSLIGQRAELKRLNDYLANKSERFQQAFQIQPGKEPMNEEKPTHPKRKSTIWDRMNDCEFRIITAEELEKERKEAAARKKSAEQDQTEKD